MKSSLTCPCLPHSVTYSVVVEAVAPGAAAEGGLHLAPVLTPRSLPDQDPAHLAPAAALAPTLGPGV